MGRYYFAVAVLAISSAALAQSGNEKDAGRYFYQNHFPDDAGTQNWSIVQDERGLMYFGNNNGVLQYDGVHWRMIPSANRTVVRSLAVDVRGRIYAGAKGDFGFLEADSSGRFVYRSVVSLVPGGHRDFSDVWDILADSNGVYFCTFKYVFLLQGERVDVIKPSGSFHRAFRCNGRNYILQVGVGLMELDTSGLKPAPAGEMYAEDRVYFILPWSPDSMLVGSRSRGLQLISGGRATVFHSDTVLSRSQLYHAVLLRDRRLAIGTLRHGMVLLDRHSGDLRTVTSADGLSDDAVYRLFEDRDGAVWLATNKGVTRIEVNSPLSFFDERDGLQGTILSISRHQGRLFVGSTQGLFELTSAAYRPIFSVRPEIASQVWSLLSAGPELLVGTNEGVLAMKEKRVRRLTRQVTFTLCRSRMDTSVVFAGLQDGIGIFRLASGRWDNMGRLPGVHEEVRTIVEAVDGSLWVGTSFQGVVHVANPSAEDSGRSVIARYHKETGLPAGFVHAYATPVHPVFVTDKGMFRFDDSARRFVQDSTFGSIFADTTRDIFLVGHDVLRNVWVFSSQRFFLSRASSTGGYAVESTVLSRVQRSRQYSLMIESDGTLWTGGVDGLIRYESFRDAPIQRPFYAMIRQLWMGQKLVYAGDVPMDRIETPFPYASNFARFEYGATSYDEERDTQFQYWLEGFDQNWSQWNRESKKDYTNLPEGEYRFHVRARNVYGVVGEGSSVAFSIRPPWYRTWWSYILFGLTGLGLLVLAFHWHDQKLIREKEELERVVRLRTDELRRKNEELAQLNDKKNEFLGIAAHDLRSPLSAVISYLDLTIQDLRQGTANLGQTANDLDTVLGAARHMNELITSLLDISAIESGRVNLDLHRENFSSVLTECEKLYSRTAQAKNIELVVEKDSYEVMIDRAKIGEVLSNLLSNAIKYTYPGGTVRVSCEAGPGVVIAHVHDTGQGLTEEDMKHLFTRFKILSARPTGGERSSGLGLAIAKKIVEMHGGQIWVESIKGKGSVFSFSIPSGGDRGLERSGV